MYQNMPYAVCVVKLLFIKITFKNENGNMRIVEITEKMWNEVEHWNLEELKSVLLLTFRLHFKQNLKVFDFYLVKKII